MDDPVWHPTTFTKNRDRLLAGDVAAAFFDAVQAHARAAGLLSDEHFTVDGTQLEAWASLKSFRCRDAAPSAPPDDPGNPTVDFHGERRRNDTHQSTTDPEAMLHRKGQGKEAKLAYLGHVLLDNRHGLAPGGDGHLDASPYDVASFVADVRVRDVTPHVAQKVRWSAIDGRTTRHAGYHVSQRKRKLVEQVFGWMKTRPSFGPCAAWRTGRVDQHGFRRAASRDHVLRAPSVRAAGRWLAAWARASINMGSAGPPIPQPPPGEPLERGRRIFLPELIERRDKLLLRRRPERSRRAVEEDRPVTMARRHARSSRP